jgi:predicted RNase H-like HicB family nuclease
VSDYRVKVFYSVEDGGWIADIPEQEACSAFGKTPTEAIAELETARKAWIAAAHELGRSIPEPRARRAL